MISFTTSKYLTLLVYPLSLSLLLLLLALVCGLLRLARTRTFFLLLGFGWLYLCSTAPFADFLSGILEKGYVSRAMSVVEQADAIVLLGGATRGDTHMSTLADLNQRADRLVHAVALYKAGKAPVVLVSGGSATGARPEAKQIKDLLEIMGVPARRILLENVSRNTRENAQFSAQILKSRDIHRILLVTSAYHMRRARALFEAEGLSVIPAPTDFQRLVAQEIIPPWLPTASRLNQTTDALHELVGIAVYRMRGWL